MIRFDSVVNYNLFSDSDSKRLHQMLQGFDSLTCFF